MFTRLQTRVRSLLESDAPAENRGFNWFGGVFTPTILTILGAIMYLRTGFVVGNAGLLGALAIIGLAHLITIATGLAVSSVSTNTGVEAGGAFSIISKSLGVEIGGSVGVPLYLAQGISVSLYVLAFAEAFISMFPTDGAPTMWLVAPITFVLVFLIAYVSAQFAVRIQFLIMGIIALSLFSIFLGSFPIGSAEGFVVQPTLFGDFTAGNFWQTFAIFFPAVTGIMAGISMSGTLRDPRRGIPIGTMAAIGVGLVVYLLLSYWLSRVATPAEMLANSTILVDKAVWGWTILAGMLGATFSSALGSLVAAPRVMAALADHRILPASEFFKKTTIGGEPRNALLVTAGVGFVTLLAAIPLGGLDALAAVLSMFFLITYSMLNLVVLIEQTLGMVSFRPTFTVPRVVPFIGLAGCVFVMFLINPTFSLVAVVVVLALYAVLARRQLKATHGDVRSGLFISMAEWAAKKASDLPTAPERTWKPSLLVPVRTTGELAGSYRFLLALTYPQGGINVLGIHPPGERERLKDLHIMTEAFHDDGVYARETIVEEEESFSASVRSATQVLRSVLFRPNLLFVRLPENGNLAETQVLVDRTAAYDMGMVVLARHPVIELGRERLINVWVTLQGQGWQTDLQKSNIDLSILMAYQLKRNWKGQINLCLAVPEQEQVPQARFFLQELTTLARLPGGTRQLVFDMPFHDALKAAPRADVSIFGLPKRSDLNFIPRIVESVDASCVFVRDSGEESALA